MGGESDLATVQAQVGSLFTAVVRCVVLPVQEGCEPVYAEELHAVVSAVPARRREFACARACAHRAIRELGRTDGPILVGRDREPLWPAGVVGAISHTSALAGAAVAGAEDARAIGFDIEQADADFHAAQRNLIFTPAELERLDALRASGLPAEVLLFSAKECVHKTLFPLTGLRLDYRDVSIDVEAGAGRFVAAVHDQRSINVAGTASIAGTLLLTASHVISAITLPR